MDFVRKFTDSDSLENFINIPESLKHRQVEIIILPYEEDAVKSTNSGISLRGRLRGYANPSLIKKEHTAWADMVSEKYENR